MKKMIHLMTAVILALAFNACSNNDNPSTPVKPFGRAVITVNTAAMYEEVDLVPFIEQKLTKNLCLTDTVLIYDQNGHLVKKLGTATKSLEPLTFVVDNLPNGTYTLVAWQTGIFENETFKVFVLADEEELTTVKLARLKNTLLYGDAIGLAYATVTVNGNSFEATVMPKLIGSFINMKSEKAPREYGFNNICLYRDDQMCKGISLDPSRSGEDRWIIGQHDGIVYPIAYLDKDETEYMHYTLEHGDDVQMYALAWSQVGDDSECTVIVETGHHKIQDGSRVAYYIDVDRISYQPPFLGPEDQLAAWKSDRDAGMLVNDPYLKWGGSLAEVKAHKQAKQYTSGNDQLVAWEDYGWHYGYFVAYDLTEQYLFDTADGQNLKTVYCAYYGGDLSADDFTTSLLLQGYTYLGKLHDPDTESYDDLFQSADEKTQVRSYLDPDGVWVMEYTPFNPEDLNNIIPTSLAPASSKVPSIVPNVRRSSLRSAAMRNNFMKPLNRCVR